MAEGTIIKAVSGFYYVYSGGELIECKARGAFRHSGETPLVGDRVEFEKGTVTRLLPRSNSFIRPAVANIDTMVFIACAAKPVTDPFLIDRVSVIAAKADCDLIVVLNKCDLAPADTLFEIYSHSGFPTVLTSAETGAGIEELRTLLRGRICAFTGNSGAGKSSIINRLIPDAHIETADISDKLGRGKHTTRHVEFYPMDSESFIADTPGFASFEVSMIADITCEELPELFSDFGPYLGGCRFNDCRHLSEPDCAVTEAVSSGKLQKTRHDSYVRLYDIVKNRKPWD
ncbi:MAG: ribosome small subunit-dependent GTPase A [Eubacteriales bacterium]|nr:ribosome small subunit-dependent GTPase A [Eubacteriales bacterium]